MRGVVRFAHVLSHYPAYFSVVIHFQGVIELIGLAWVENLVPVIRVPQGAFQDNLWRVRGGSDVHRSNCLLVFGYERRRHLATDSHRRLLLLRLQSEVGKEARVGLPVVVDRHLIAFVDKVLEAHLDLLLGSIGSVRRLWAFKSADHFTDGLDVQRVVLELHHILMLKGIMPRGIVSLQQLAKDVVAVGKCSVVRELLLDLLDVLAIRVLSDHCSLFLLNGRLLLNLETLVELEGSDIVGVTSLLTSE